MSGSERAMTRRDKDTVERGPSDVEAALAALGADALRDTVRELLLELDERTHSRVVSSLLDRAARSGTGWAPAALSNDEVAEVLAFAEAARQDGRAEPHEIDEYLGRGAGAFLRKDYATAFQVYGALLRPIGEGEIDLGQHEQVDDVLGVDPGECAAQYVVCAYMTAAPGRRAEAVRAAIDEVQSLGRFWEPIRQMEQVAVEPLPGLDDFLGRWKALIAREAGAGRPDDRDDDQDRWLREVVRRLDGAAGLAKVARSTRRADDLRAWCEILVEAGNWEAALAGFDEAAEIVADKEYVRGEFLDGAALAAQELGRSDLPSRLERAWRASPNMLRLRRWLGSAGNKTMVRKCAAEALGVCPSGAHRQRAFLQVLLGDFAPAAKLLAEAPGLGWSGSEHPGHLLFPVFEALLGSKPMTEIPPGGLPAYLAMDIEEIDLRTANDGGSRLATPSVHQILRQVGTDGIPDGAARDAVLAGMRAAAQRRVAAVTEHKRRHHYRHAALLVAAYAACDGSPQAARWAASVRTEYRRFPALCAELDGALGAA